MFENIGSRDLKIRSWYFCDIIRSNSGSAISNHSSPFGGFASFIN